MYGPPPVMSPVPPAGRASASRNGLWVLVGVVLIGGVGFFAFIPLTVLAVRSRADQRTAARNAALALASFVLMVVAVAVSPQHQDSAHEPWWYGVLAFAMLGQGVATTAWFIRCDRRWLRQRQVSSGVRPPAHWVPGAPTLPTGPMGPRDATGPRDAIGPTAVLPTVALPFAPLPPQPDRLGQVRAELDELSDYLRREQGR
ncbi:hypothetical protein ABH931_007591 [Streptacidiphilus sp. MAP12-33]|uniref:hypothetical protein n=1 Tax=Streptacidiphilus sp. MAP12-33 TaxID=3156266 RepID=UPI0035123FF5